jgi:small subunit ribosomal protein S18
MERKNSRTSGERKPFKKDADGGFGGRRGGSSSGGGHRPSRMSIPRGTEIDYKNIAFLQKCLTERGKVFSRRLTSASAKQQRQIIVSVKRARFLGLLPVGSSRKKG